MQQDGLIARNVVIVGTGGLARDVLWLLRCHNDAGMEPAYVFLGFLSPAWTGSGEEVCGVPVLGPEDLLAGQHEEGGALAVCALDDPRDRKETMVRLRNRGVQFISLVHASAAVSPLARIGTGCLLLPGAVVSTEAHVGEGAVIHAHASVGPRALVGDFAVVGAGARLGGLSVVGEAAWVGPNSVIAEGQRVSPGPVAGPGTA